jgi:hypothetical protein
VIALLRRPSAFLPLVISGAFLIAFSIGLAEGRLVRQADEDAGAHLFQILMPTQFLIMAFFAFSWFPKMPKPTLEVLALQVSAALAVIAVVYFRHL